MGSVVARASGGDLHGHAARADSGMSSARHAPAVHAPAVRIRWRIFAMLFDFGFIAYLQQKSITVTAEPMMPELGLSQFQISLIEWAFVLGYGLFQLPGGIFGQHQGARRTFVIIGLAAFLATVATPLAPYWLTGAGLFAVLLLLQLLLGCSQAAISPSVECETTRIIKSISLPRRIIR